MTLADAVQQLYRTPPARFVAARDALAAETAGRGDAELAARIRRLRRPAPAAWLVDVLARDGGLDALAELGERFRAAQAEGDRAALAELAAERKTALAALATEARRVAHEAGVSLPATALSGLDETLRAVVADEAAADAARSGALVRPLAADGLEPADLDGALAGDESSSPRPRPRSAEAAPAPPRHGRRGASRPSADDVARRAEEAAAEADAELERVEARVAELDADRERVADDLRRLRDEFAAAEAQQAELDDREKFLRRERRRAVEDAKAARREATRARDAADDA